VYEETHAYEKWPDEDGDLVCYTGGGIVFQDLEVRDLDDRGSHRLYVSNACGACDTKHIDYIDVGGDGEKTLYYDLSAAPIGVASCEGHLVSHWAGHFAFDDANNLYISSGNHCPSALFRISGAALDAVSGTAQQVYQRTPAR